MINRPLPRTLQGRFGPLTPQDSTTALAMIYARQEHIDFLNHLMNPFLPFDGKRYQTPQKLRDWHRAIIPARIAELKSEIQTLEREVERLYNAGLRVRGGIDRPQVQREFRPAKRRAATPAGSPHIPTKISDWE